MTEEDAIKIWQNLADIHSVLETNLPAFDTHLEGIAQDTDNIASFMARAAAAAERQATALEAIANMIAEGFSTEISDLRTFHFPVKSIRVAPERKQPNEQYGKSEPKPPIGGIGEAASSASEHSSD